MDQRIEGHQRLIPLTRPCPVGRVVLPWCPPKHQSRDDPSRCPQKASRDGELVQHAPEGCYCFFVSLKEVFEKAIAIERWRIGIAFAIFTKFSGPIGRLSWIDDFKESSRIQIRTPLIIEDTKRVGLNPDHHILLVRGEGGIAGVSSAELDNHLSANTVRGVCTTRLIYQKEDEFPN